MEIIAVALIIILGVALAAVSVYAHREHGRALREREERTSLKWMLNRLGFKPTGDQYSDWELKDERAFIPADRHRSMLRGLMVAMGVEENYANPEWDGTTHHLDARFDTDQFAADLQLYAEARETTDELTMAMERLGATEDEGEF